MFFHSSGINTEIFSSSTLVIITDFIFSVQSSDVFNFLSYSKLMSTQIIVVFSIVLRFPYFTSEILDAIDRSVSYLKFAGPWELVSC